MLPSSNLGARGAITGAFKGSSFFTKCRRMILRRYIFDGSYSSCSVSSWLMNRQASGSCLTSNGSMISSTTGRCSGNRSRRVVLALARRRGSGADTQGSFSGAGVFGSKPSIRNSNWLGSICRLLRPRKAPLLQPLGAHPQPASIPKQATHQLHLLRTMELDPRPARQLDDQSRIASLRSVLTLTRPSTSVFNISASDNGLPPKKWTVI